MIERFCRPATVVAWICRFCTAAARTIPAICSAQRQHLERTRFRRGADNGVRTAEQTTVPTDSCPDFAFVTAAALEHPSCAAAINI